MTNKVKQLREQSSLTQEQFANLLKVSRQSVISIEKGHYVPTTVLALKMAAVLKRKVEDLFALEKSDWT
jgi:putative transcriptional regulator